MDWKEFRKGFFDKRIWIVFFSTMVGIGIGHYATLYNISHKNSSKTCQCNSTECINNNTLDVTLLSANEDEIYVRELDPLCQYYYFGKNHGLSCQYDSFSVVPNVKPDSLVVNRFTYIDYLKLGICINHTDTPEPVCPYCGNTKFNGYYSQSNIKNNIHYKVSIRENIYFDILQYITPSFYRCNRCDGDFTIDKHCLEYKKDGITYKTDEVYYTTERIEGWDMTPYQTRH